MLVRQQIPTNLRRVFIAWMLMAIFLLPFIVKSVHVCAVDDAATYGTSQAAGQHSPGHDADNCAICHFTLFSFTKAATLVLQALVVVTTGVFVCMVVPKCRQRQVAVVSLRAPPSTFRG